MITVAALYHFTPFPDPQDLRGPLFDLAKAQGIMGTLLLATEGINGTIAGTREVIDAILAHIRALPGCADLVWKESHADKMPFVRMKVRIKPEIVTLGVAGVDPLARVGRHVPPQDWNALIQAPDVAVIDTRNAYEISIGTFEGAIDPGTSTFREFPAWWQENQHKFAGKRIAMFCTGGIRCEKSTNFLLGEGVEEVYHLKGGILKYLEEMPQEESTWRGECFVFDERVSVKHGLELGEMELCHACRRPISQEDKASAHFIEGVACPACYAERTDEDRARFAERQKQIALAKKRGKQHIGVNPRLDD